MLAYKLIHTKHKPQLFQHNCYICDFICKGIGIVLSASCIVIDIRLATLEHAPAYVALSQFPRRPVYAALSMTAKIPRLFRIS